MPMKAKKHTQPGPDLSLETAVRETNARGIVAGVDEAGRGPWAGPVVASAVILDATNIPDGLNDSKKLSPQKRARLFDQIKASASFGVGWASVEEIDEINILAATMLAMRRAVADLPIIPNTILVDGNRDPGMDIPTKCIIKGDGKSLSIAAASIIAKVTRDRYMAELSQQFPDYGWEKNAGYGVPKHQDALKLVGISPFHRKSFAPIAKILNEES